MVLRRRTVIIFNRTKKIRDYKFLMSFYGIVKILQVLVQVCLLLGLASFVESDLNDLGLFGLGENLIILAFNIAPLITGVRAPKKYNTLIYLETANLVFCYFMAFLTIMIYNKDVMNTKFNSSYFLENFGEGYPVLFGNVVLLAEGALDLNGTIVTIPVPNLVIEIVAVIALILRACKAADEEGNQGGRPSGNAEQTEGTELDQIE